MRPLPQVVIVAGGAGTRLAGALPAEVPKILAPVRGRAFLAYVLDLLVTQGVRRVHLCLGQGAAQVQAFLETYRRPELAITSTVEKEALGTAGCLRAAAEAIDEEFILLLGDTYTPIDLRGLVDRYRATGAEAGMAVLHNRDSLVISNIAIDGDRVVRYDKAAPPGTFEYIDYGIALLRRSSLDRLPATRRVDLAELFGSLISDGQLAALPVEHRFYEIGTPESYADFRHLVDAGKLPGLPLKRRLSSRPVFESPWMSVREDAIELADGSRSTFAVVSRPDSVLIVCDFPDGALLMTRQYRYASRRWSLELPQGGREPGESAADAALRELREESGWIATEPRVIADRLYEAGDWATQSITVVRVRPVRQDTPCAEAGEAGIESLLVPRDRLAGCVRSGELCDAATLAALFLADHLDPATTREETQ